MKNILLKLRPMVHIGRNTQTLTAVTMTCALLLTSTKASAEWRFPGLRRRKHRLRRSEHQRRASAHRYPRRICRTGL